MLSFLIVVATLILLLIILMAAVYIGRAFGKWQKKRHPTHKLEIVSVAESSVFALLALLIAFTFSGAFDRFEIRKVQILEQANAFDQAMYHVDLIQQQYRSTLRQDIVKYMNLHLDAYHDIPDMELVREDLDRALKTEQAMWHTAVIAAEATPNSEMAQTFINSMSNLIEHAHTGINMTKMHAPAIIFFLMIGLASLGAFLIGFDSIETKHKHPIHVSFYVILTAVTIYIIINLEYPRVGFIRTSSFDQAIIDVRDHTNKFASLLS